MIRMVLTLVILAVTAGGALGATWTVAPSGGDFTSIQAAIAAASDGDIINIAAGTYLERPVANKQLTFAGADEATVIIDAGAGAVGGSYGFTVSADNVSISDLTLVGDPGLNPPRYGFKPSNVADFTLTNVTAKNFYRTGVDLLGVTNGALTDITSIDNGGHGLALTDCNGVTVTNLAVSGNSWEGVSVATWGNFSPLGTSGIVFAGTNAFTDNFQLEMGDFANPGVAPAGDAIITFSTNIGDGADVTVQAGDFAFAVHGTQDDSPGQVRVWLKSDLAAAAAMTAGGPVGHFTGANYYIEGLVDGVLYAAPGSSIQAAIDAAASGGTVQVLDGSYAESLNIYKPLSLIGQSEGGVTIDASVFSDYSIDASGDHAFTFSDFTLVGNPVFATAYGLKISGDSASCDVRRVTIRDSYRSGLDCNGLNGGVIEDCTITGTVYGVGLGLTDCDGFTITNLTTSGNAWAGAAVYSGATSYTGGSDNVVFAGALNLSEAVPLYTEVIAPYEVTNLVVPVAALGALSGNNLNPAAVAYLPTVAGAQVGVVGTDPVNGWVVDRTDGSFAVATGMSIEAAIVAASSGDVVNVGPGTYVEAGQIVIDKDITLVGDAGSRPIVMTDANTGSSGDARGWFLQTAGTQLNMSNFELDGGGFDVYQGIRSTGGGAIDNCAFRNITFPGYAGVGIAAFGAADWDVQNCSFDNIGRVGFLAYGAGLANSSFVGNTYTGKGAGDWLDYACDISAGAVLTVEDNAVTNCLGVASSDGSTSAALLVTTFFGTGTTAAINNNVLTGNTTGVAVGYDASDVSVVSGSGNDLSNNASYGVSNSAPNQVDFSNNWWGATSGPYNATLNPSGTGSVVDEFVTFEPWSGPGSVAVVPASAGPVACGDAQVFTFNLTTDAYTPDVFGFNAVVRASPELTWGAITSLAPFGGTTVFQTFDQGDGSYIISGTTTASPTQPISGAGTTPLFSIEFTAASEGSGAITFDALVLRDPANAPISVTGTGGSLDIDCTAPAAVTAITATPGHNKVEVSWTHDGSDVDHYEVFSGLWYDTTAGNSAYPEYDDQPGSTIPTAPSSPAVAGTSSEWAQLPDAAVTNLTQTWPDATSRGVYYYTVFAVDAVGNASPAPVALDRATNYWLGDVNSAGGGGPDGEVGVFDINDLGTFFGLAVPLDAAYNHNDVGPTDDWSRLGIPLTDNLINFEDLIIFSLNYGVVSAAKSKPMVSPSIALAWVTYDNGDLGLRLEDGSGLKALNIRADVPVQGVEAGQLLDEQAELTFLKNVGETLDVSVAVMGVNQAFEGRGDLFIVRGVASVKPEDLHITARSIENEDLEVKLTQASGTLTPRVFSLNANYPNPFNPTTKISFSLPESQPVRLSVYSLDGRRVATLLNETRGPGLHEVVWKGQDDDGHSVASGVYFYRIDAGPYSQVRKMTLMK